MFVDNETKIENTSMQEYDNKTYWIKPNEGYKLHAKEFDSETEDPETGEITKEIRFTTGIVTCGVKYDFEKNERELYTIPEDVVVEPKVINPENEATESDYINAVTGGVPVISTWCDAKEENTDELKAERIKGTVTEQSFDVFTVNTKEKKIYATKIGAGEDRVISY